MTQHAETFQAIPVEQLEEVMGGAEGAAIAQQVGGLVDKFTGGTEGSQIAVLVGGFLG